MLKNHLQQTKMRAEAELKDIRDQHDQDIARMVDRFEQQKGGLQHAYDVHISKEAEILEDKLNEIRIKASERVDGEQKAHETEMTNLKKSHQARVEEYRRNSDHQLDKMRKELQSATDNLHQQAKRVSKRDKEVAKS